MDEHTKQLGEAITTILDAIEANEIARSNSPLRSIVDKPRMYTLADLDREVEDGSEWVRDPIGMALRSGLRSMGKTIAKFKTTTEMQEIAEQAAGEKNFQWRINVIDKNWDGITDKGGDTWWA
jgi:hypothetical protein